MEPGTNRAQLLAEHARESTRGAVQALSCKSIDIAVLRSELPTSLQVDIDLTRFLVPGDTVMWGQAMAEPLTLTRALVAQRQALSRLRIFVGIGTSDTLSPEQTDAFDFIGYTASGTHRALATAGVLDILPGHYSQLPRLISSGALRIGGGMVEVSPPDEHGRYSLGLAHEYLVAALASARVIIAEEHPDVPWVHGERSLCAADIHALVPSRHELIEPTAGVARSVDQAIARHVAGLVEDGSTLQIGIGTLPETVVAALGDRRDLGLHTGAAGDAVAALAQAGVLTNARKAIDRGAAVAGLLMGGKLLRQWAHRNPALQMRGTQYTHDHGVLAALDKLVAINSAMEVDLTGQINSEVAGGVYMGAVGGAVDFMRGAQQSRGGLPILALPSTAGNASRIVARLSGPVSTSRADAGIVVTEHGVADLRGQTLSRRVRRMIDIAAPEHRADLDKQAFEQLRLAGARLAI